MKIIIHKDGSAELVEDNKNGFELFLPKDLYSKDDSLFKTSYFLNKPLVNITIYSSLCEESFKK